VEQDERREIAVRMLAGRYRLGDVVGRGGSAVVYGGFDRTLKRPIAVKLFSPYRPHAGEFAAAVLREAQTAARLSHPNVARVYDFGEVIDGDERTPYLVMELLDGETLADRLARTGALPWRQAVEICAAIAAGLAAAHGQGSVHRDVKPRNIMLSTAGVKVLDFGIAAAAGQSSFDTQGRLWGTAAYLAPEQLRGEAAFPAADVYALGLLLLECLTGKPAWPGETVGEILAARHDRPAPPLPPVAGLPREILRLYRACIAAAPYRRPSAAEATEILHRAAGTAPILRQAITAKKVITAKVVAAPRPARLRRRTALLASAAAVTALLSVAGVQLANAGSTPNPRPAEAAVDGARPAIPSPRPATAAPSPTTTATATPTHRPATTTRATTAVIPIATGREESSRPATTPPTMKPTKPTPSPSEPESSPSATATSSPSPTASDDPTTSPSTAPTDPEPPAPTTTTSADPDTA
jgi:serine/threonine protein kinase